jgi:hypothetical protein
MEVLATVRQAVAATIRGARRVSGRAQCLKQATRYAAVSRPNAGPARTRKLLACSLLAYTEDWRVRLRDASGRGACGRVADLGHGAIPSTNVANRARSHTPHPPSLIGGGPGFHLVLERVGTIIRERVGRVR